MVARAGEDDRPRADDVPKVNSVSPAAVSLLQTHRNVAYLITFHPHDPTQRAYSVVTHNPDHGSIASKAAVKRFFFKNCHRSPSCSSKSGPITVARRHRLQYGDIVGSLRRDATVHCCNPSQSEPNTFVGRLRIVSQEAAWPRCHPPSEYIRAIHH